MSKHQACAICKRDFPGPDCDIGENLCQDCMDEVHGECRTEIHRLSGENVRLEDKLSEKDSDISTLTAERDDLLQKLNHSAVVQRKINVDVLKALNETSPTNPEEHYIPPVTMAVRVRTLTTENKRLTIWYDAWAASHGNTHAEVVGKLQEQIATLTAERDELFKVLELLTKNEHDAVSIERCDSAYKWLVTASWDVGDELDHMQGNSDSLLEALLQAASEAKP